MAEYDLVIHNTTISTAADVVEGDIGRPAGLCPLGSGYQSRGQGLADLVNRDHMRANGNSRDISQCS
jgi:hypothetical protein